MIDGAIFETTDAYGNLIRLGLEAIFQAESGIKALFTHKKHLLLSMSIEMIPYCSPVLSPDHYYTIFFHHKGTSYSIDGKLVDFAPKSLALKFFVPCTIIQHGKRKSRRVPLTFEQIQVQIEDEVFEVSDLSLSGAGIIVNDRDRFRPGQEVEIKLVIRGRSYKGKGNVQHLTPHARDKFVCGINIEYHDEQNLCSIQQLIHEKGGGEDYPK